jgi:hypothetical protein
MPRGQHEGREEQRGGHRQKSACCCHRQGLQMKRMGPPRRERGQWQGGGRAGRRIPAEAAGHSRRSPVAAVRILVEADRIPAEAAGHSRHSPVAAVRIRWLGLVGDVRILVEADRIPAEAAGHSRHSPVAAVRIPAGVVGRIPAGVVGRNRGPVGDGQSRHIPEAVEAGRIHRHHQMVRMGWRCHRRNWTRGWGRAGPQQEGPS